MEEGSGHSIVDEDAADRLLTEAGLAERFRGRLIVLAARRLGSSQTAEDVAQEVLRRVVEALRGNRLHDPGALGTFVFQTARNVCLHHARKSGREQRALGAVAAGRAEPCGADPLLTLVDRERRFAVRRALERLGAADRELLWALFWEGLGYEELAGRLGTTPQALRVRKHRALRRLDRLLPMRPAETKPADREPDRR